MADAAGNLAPKVGEALLEELFDRANTVLEKARTSALEPENEKVLRRFTLKEATRLLGIHTDTFYGLVKDPTANEIGRAHV